MFVPFDSMPPSSRIWIFQSNRKFTEDEHRVIADKLAFFTQHWAAHGQPLKSSYHLGYNQFIIIAADENFHTPSGCSIDSSFRTLKDIEEITGLNLFDRTQVAFLQHDHVELVPLQELKQKFANGILNQGTLAFNNVIATKNQLDTEWLLPVSQTWLKRYIPQAIMNVG